MRLGGAGVAGCSDLSKPIDEEPVLRRAAERLQRRNLESLVQAQGPGGEPIAPNTKGYARRKGHDRIGFLTGEMAAGLVASDGVNLTVGGDVAEAEVFAGPGGTDMKVNIFLAGKPGEERWQSAETRSGRRKAWRYEGPPVPPRDFIGIDERDVEAAGDDALETILNGWGFA